MIWLLCSYLETNTEMTVLRLRPEVTIKVNCIIPWVLGKYGTTPQSTCIDQYIQSTKDILLLASNRNLT